MFPELRHARRSDQRSVKERRRRRSRRDGRCYGRGYCGRKARVGRRRRPPPRRHRVAWYGQPHFPRCRSRGWLDVLHGEGQRALLALAHGRAHAEGARDGERFVGVEIAAWDGTHDEVYVNRIYRHRRAGGGAVWTRRDRRRAVAEG